MAERIGLLAGSGCLPVHAARGIRAAGFEPVIIGLAEEAGPELEAEAPGMELVSLGRLGEIARRFRARNVRRLIMAGKVQKTRFFSDIEMDGDLRALLDRLPRKNDDAILGAIVNYLGRAGLIVLPQVEFLRELLAPKGVLSRRAPDGRERADIIFGFAMAKEIGALDFGQSVVVKDRAVLAVEAAEGTDETIRRGGRLGRRGAVLVKVSKPRQDPRFDMPTVGPETIAQALEAGFSALAVEAGRTFFIAREDSLAEADRGGLAVVGVGSRGLY